MDETISIIWVLEQTNNFFKAKLVMANGGESYSSTALAVFFLRARFGAAAHENETFICNACECRALVFRRFVYR